MNISAANPINNIANSDILNSIVGAFTEIEKHDIRVEKVTLTQEKYDELITRKGSLEYLCQNNHGLVGALWGTQLEIGEESKVFGERGFMPSGLYYNSPAVGGVHYKCMEVKINFGTPMTKEAEKAYQYQQKKLQLKNNMTIIVHSRAQPIRKAGDNEMTAIETLREMITEAEFRKYMVHGFILVCS